MTDSIVLIIPAFNAAPTLGEVLASIEPHALPILLINDGSSDATLQTAMDSGLCQCHSHEANRGKGAALKTGFRIALEEGFTHALTFDADGQHPAEAIPSFLRKCAEQPEAILVGNRFASPDYRDMPPVRRLSNRLSSKLISLASGARIPDAQCGMRVYPLPLVTSLHLASDGYALETEVLVKAGRRKTCIENIPISCHYPSGTTTSHYRALADSWRIANIVYQSLRNP